MVASGLQSVFYAQLTISPSRPTKVPATCIEPSQYEEITPHSTSVDKEVSTVHV